MTGASELFVITLARASRRARRYLRYLNSADRDDVLAAAILWCWEHRTKYDPSVSLEDWLVSAIKNAKRDLRRGELREAAEVIADIPVSDDTVARAEALESAQQIVEALPPESRKAAYHIARGETRGEMIAQGVTQWAIDNTRAQLKKLRHLMPDEHEFRRVLRFSPGPDSDDLNKEPAPIDKEIERLEFAPPQGKECPPCWRCKWFEGFLPGAHVPVKMPVVEPDIKEAVAATEKRKIDIANLVREGRVGFTGVFS
jgi:RNA polymerase sigma factor (sigma-70 family)